MDAEWSRAVGAAELKPRVAMTTRTSFHFASVTKMATAALALRLAERERLGLDDPIIRWYPAWRGDRAATVRDLLGHTAGTKDPTDAALTRLDRHARPLTVRAYIGAAPRPGPLTRLGGIFRRRLRDRGHHPRPRRPRTARPGDA